ncbi:hypothetical protein NMY22_g1444 [Coprinellus aureogranulatus]|nr:hypothetical protein NMY22_g1444 [Coprinellus aureogranulatus]
MKATADNSEARKALVAKMEAQVEVRKEEAKVCLAWFRERFKAWNEKIDKIREDRYDFIRDKLIEMGYGPEFEFIDEHDAGPGWHYSDRWICPEVLNFHSLREVQQAAPITDRIWDNRVKEPVVGYIEEVRKLRLGHERKEVISNRGVVFADAWVKWLGQKAQVQRYAPDILMPSIADIVEHPTVKALLETPGDAEVTESQCMAIVENMPDFIAEWCQQKNEALFKLVPRSVFEGDDFLRAWLDGRKNPRTETRWMELAMVVFKCKEVKSPVDSAVIVCDNPTRGDSTTPPNYHDNIGDISWKTYDDRLYFPEYLHHPCCKYTSRSWEERQYDYNPFLVVDRLLLDKHRKLQRKKWDVEKLVFDEKASKVVRRVLQACGLPLYTRAPELDLQNLQIVCLNCSPGGAIHRGALVTPRTWRVMVRHIIDTHWGSTSVRMQKLTDVDAARARSAARDEAKRRSNYPGGWYGRSTEIVRKYKCLFCRDAPYEPGRLSWTVFLEHLEKYHDIRRETVKRYYDDGELYTSLQWELAPLPPLEIQIETQDEYSRK